MLAWVAVLCLAAHDLQDDPSRGRLGLSVSGGAAFTPNATSQLNGELEGLWLPSPYFRIGLDLGGLWHRDALGGARGLIAFDAAIPQWWGEWFVGIGGGAAYANVFPDGAWHAAGAGRARFGADLVLFRPISVGVSISYWLLAVPIVHSASIDLRAGVAF
jgi:hypothetical protein